MEQLYKKKEKIPSYFKVDEIDVDSYFFHSVLDISICYSRLVRIGKGLAYSTYSIKKFVFNHKIHKQSFELDLELPLSQSELAFILGSVAETIREYRARVKNFIPLPEPKQIISPNQSSLFFHFHLDFKKDQDTLIRIGVRFPNIYLLKFEFQNVTQIDIRLPELEYLEKNLTYLESYLIYYS